MKASLKNPKLKVERAKEHLDVLNVKVREFQDAKPFGFTAHEDIQNGLYVIRLQIPIIDPKLAIVAGDAIDNLRSSLDHIAWQLALTTKAKPRGSTSFPIVDKDTLENMRNLRNVTKDIPPRAVDEIKALQPYQRGPAYKDDILWKLNKLCNINKHRVIPAHGTALNFNIPKGIKPGFGTLDNAYIVTMPISAKAKMQLAPLPTADVLFGSEVDGLVISFRELPNIYEYVRDTVFPRFTSFFSE